MKKLFTLLGVALCVLYMHATPVMVKPGLTLEQINGVYYIHFVMPDYTIKTDTFVVECNSSSPDPSGATSVAIEEHYFNSIKIYGNDRYDYLFDVGRPVLPFYSLSLLLPSDFQELGNVSENIVQLSEETLTYHYTPVQLRMNRCDLSYDEDYYIFGDDTWYADNWAIDFIQYRHSNGFVFSFFPFHYDPETQTLSVIEEAYFEIPYDGTPITSNYLDNILYEDGSIYHFFDNFIGHLFPQFDINENYLIVVGDQWANETALADFVAHKEDLGYNVAVAALHEIGYSPDDIRSYIKMYFETYHTKFVLLVGDVDEIPFYDGDEEDTTDPPSDTYYACLSKDNISDQYLDFSPSVFLGRWPIQSSTQLRNVVDKTIASDLHLGESNPETYQIELFSGTGNGYQSWAMYEDCNYFYDNIIHEYTHFTGAVHDGRSYGSSSAAYNAVKTNLETDNPPTWMFIYEGFGTNTELTPPYCFHKDSIPHIITSTLDFQPFGFGFADLLGNIYSPDNFARTWLTDTEGGVTFLGATTTTALIADRYFSRKVFDPLDAATKPIMTIGQLVGNAKAKYYNCDKVVWRRREAKKYVLYGDPSLHLFGIDINYNLPLEVKYRPHTPNERDKLIDSLKDVRSIQIYSITGQLMRTFDSKEMSLQGLPAGTYLVVVQTTDNTATKKITLR